MGRLTYESIKVDFEDRLLAHLQLAIGSKVRRGESFHFSWRDDPSVGDGRTVIWIHPAASISYKYYGSKQPAINRRWLEDLTTTANSVGGLHLVPEPPEDAAEATT